MLASLGWRNSPKHYFILLFHNFTILCLDHDVRVLSTFILVLVLMCFRPFYSHLIPVEVAEHHSKAWFRSLLSAIDFLHQRGVVHNDIK